jgi:hypothetical protein
MASRKRVGMTPADFKRIALSLEGVEEGSHMGAVDFRVGGRIFATLASQAQGYGNLALTPEEQAVFCQELPDVFVPIAGGWGPDGDDSYRARQGQRGRPSRSPPDSMAAACQDERAHKKTTYPEGARALRGPGLPNKTLPPTTGV